MKLSILGKQQIKSCNRGERSDARRKPFLGSVFTGKKISQPVHQIT